MGHQRPSWPLLGPSWAILGPSWPILGPSWRHLGAILAPLGPILGPLGAIFAHLKAILKPSSLLIRSLYESVRKPKEKQGFSAPAARIRRGASPGARPGFPSRPPFPLRSTSSPTKLSAGAGLRPLRRFPSPEQHENGKRRMYLSWSYLELSSLSLCIYIYAKTYTKQKFLDSDFQEARNNEQYDLSLQV